MGKEWGKIPRGITVRENASGERIQVAFTYKGARCRELLKIPVTKANIKYAANLLGEIQNSIERKTFSYVEYFPNSPKAKKFGIVIDKSKTVADYLDEYQVSCIKRGLSPSSIEGYRKVKNSVSELHDIKVIDLTPGLLKDFVVTSKNSPKTLRNKFSYLRSALAEAVTEGLVPINPIDTIKLSNYVKKDNKVSITGSHNDVDPFGPKEIEAIYSKCRPDELNVVQFVFNTGMRPSEWSALKWADIDFVNSQVNVTTAIVVGQLKGTKTKAGRRSIPLNEIALAALARQKEITFLHNDYIFMKMQTGVQFPKRELNRVDPDSFRKHQWGRILKAAGVRYRYPYQMRHTFATMHISTGENIWKIAKWMGHASPEMLFRHYGSFIEEFQQNDTTLTPSDIAKIQ
jgi:integrase